MNDGMCTEDMIEDLLVELIHIAERNLCWKTDFFSDENDPYAKLLSQLSMAQSLLTIDGHMLEIARQVNSININLSRIENHLNDMNIKL